MQSSGTLQNQVSRRRSRLVGAGVATILGCLFLLVFLLGVFGGRPQSSASTAMPIAAADVKDLQAEIDRTAQDLVVLRGTVDQMRIDIAGLRAQRGDQAASANGRLADLQTTLPVGNPGVSVRASSYESLAHPAPPVHPGRRGTRLRTVVVDGVTYVEGREPHDLSLPLQ